MDDPSNHGVYELNTIANYDPEIIHFLTFPVGTEVERDQGGLRVVSGHQPPAVTLLSALQPGPLAITQRCDAVTDEGLFRRSENGSLVLWRPGLTFWISASHGHTSNARDNMAHFRRRLSPRAFEVESSESAGMLRLVYRVDETGSDGRILQSYQMIGCAGRDVIIISSYFDDEMAKGAAARLLRSVRAAPDRASST